MKKLLDYERAVLFDLQDVSAVITINPDTLGRYGQECRYNGLDFTRLRFQVRSYRGTADGKPVFPRRPYGTSHSWFVSKEDILDWDVFLADLKASKLLENVPEKVDKVTQKENLLREVNNLLAGSPLREAPSDKMSPLSRYTLAEWRTLRQPASWAQDNGLGQVRRWVVPSASNPAGGDRVMLNRLNLEAWLPRGLARASVTHTPLVVSASEGPKLERTALQQVAVFLRRGTGVDTSKAVILLRHLGDGWITMTDRPDGFAIPWDAAPLEQIRPLAVDRDWDKIDEDIPGFLLEFFRGTGRARIQLVEHWSVFYPMMGTYEVLIPSEVAKQPSFEYKVVLRGCSVQSARDASHHIPGEKPHPGDNR
jgi:hypothetical protein